MPIVYGFPGDQTVEQADRGEIQLGGCCVSVIADVAKRLETLEHESLPELAR
jgi:hypothetical protein